MQLMAGHYHRPAARPAQQALAIARDTHCTLSETVADLMRRGLVSATALPRCPQTPERDCLVSVGTHLSEVAFIRGRCSDANVLIALVVASMCIMMPRRTGLAASDTGFRAPMTQGEAWFDSRCAWTARGAWHASRPSAHYLGPPFAGRGQQGWAPQTDAYPAEATTGWRRSTAA